MMPLYPDVKPTPCIKKHSTTSCVKPIRPKRKSSSDTETNTGNLPCDKINEPLFLVSRCGSKKEISAHHEETLDYDIVVLQKRAHMQRSAYMAQGNAYCEQEPEEINAMIAAILLCKISMIRTLASSTADRRFFLKLELSIA